MQKPITLAHNSDAGVQSLVLQLKRSDPTAHAAARSGWKLNPACEVSVAARLCAGFYSREIKPLKILKFRLEKGLFVDVGKGGLQADKKPRMGLFVLR